MPQMNSKDNGIEADPVTTAAAKELIRQHGATPDKALFAACEKGAHHTNIIVCLVKEFGANVRATNEYNSTPLHIAAKCGQLDAVLLLAKELGADISAQTVQGWT